MVFLLLTKEKQDPQLFPLPIPVHRSGDLAQSFLSVWGPGLRFSLVRNSISSGMSGARSQLTGCLIEEQHSAVFKRCKLVAEIGTHCPLMKSLLACQPSREPRSTLG